MSSSFAGEQRFCSAIPTRLQVCVNTRGARSSTRDV
jgi:hypothetical protein